MKRQQLYINGTAVDMPSDEIKIKVASNILEDADSVMTAHSYNIALPRTMKNDSVFALAYVPTAKTANKSTHKYLQCALHLDDVPLFEDGQAVLTSVDDKGYNLTLLWGLLGMFDKIKDEGLELCDLPLSAYWDDINETWVQLARQNAQLSYVSGMNNDIFGGLDNQSEIEMLPWTLPVVSANDILGTISNVYGITFDFSGTATTRINELYHPLTSLKPKADDEVLYLGISAGFTLVNGNYHLTYYPITTSTDFPDDIVFSNLTAAYWYANNDKIGNNAIWAFNDANGHINAKCDLNIRKIRVHGTPPTSANCKVIINSGGDSEDTQTFTAAFDYTWEDVSIKRGESVIQIGSTSHWVGTPPATNIRVEMEIDGMSGMVISYQALKYLNTWYGLVRNYPNMGVIEYISEILAHIGAFIVGSVTDTGKLKVITFDELFANTPNTYDTQGVEKITMSLDDVAQRNIYTHQNNEDNVPYEGKGIIYTSDKTLKEERDAFKSSFKVPYNAMVRLFKVEDSKGSWVGSGDYIAGKSGYTLRNTGQGFETILNNYYSQNKAMMRTPKTLELVVRLTLFDLRHFDFTKPVFIPQLGCNYLVQNLQSDKGDNYKLELIQI